MSADYPSGGASGRSASDLHVEQTSDALAGRWLDVVVSGSIGAVESVRFVRGLRRLGADVQAWLTAGGAEFITPLALSWATAREVRRAFTGDASHIALGDACVVAPASASLIGKVAHGITDSPGAALVTSYLGQRKPVFLLPNMHMSLAEAPAVVANLRRLQDFGVRLLGARLEEGKSKFPEPDMLADEVAHRLNQPARDGAAALVTMGTTRGYVDDVRYLSNYSSGALGSAISEELYRHGFATHVVCGPCPLRPRVATRLVAVETNEQMKAAAVEAVTAHGARAAVFAASVLDYVPKNRQQGKISSSKDELTIVCAPTEKIIAGVQPKGPAKVGFKLETGLTEPRARELAADYAQRYGLTAVVLNDLADVDATRHRAFLFEVHGGQLAAGGPAVIDGKRAIAAHIARHVRERLV